MEYTKLNFFKNFKNTSNKLKLIKEYLANLDFIKDNGFIYTLFDLFFKNSDSIHELIKYKSQFNTFNFNESNISTFINSFIILIKNEEYDFNFIDKILFQEINYLVNNKIDLKYRTLSLLIDFYSETYLNDIDYKIIQKKRLLELWDYVIKYDIVLNETNYILLIKYCIIFEHGSFIDKIFLRASNYLYYFSNKYLDLLNPYIYKINYDNDGNIKIVNQDINIKLKKYIFDENDRLYYCKFFENSIKLQNITSYNYLVKFLKRTNLNVVIDGANIGFQKGKKINFDTINYIYLILKKKNYNPIICLHKRHLKSVNEQNNKIISQWLKNKALFTTPYHVNDDWYWLYMALSIPNCKFVTKDKMKDHYFQLISDSLDINNSISSFKFWYKENNINYFISDKQITIYEPLNFSLRLQIICKKNKKYFILPTETQELYMLEQIA
jgi:hypothetical protein